MSKRKYTDWFSYENNPSRVGLYECDCGHKHLWNGYDWVWMHGALKGMKLIRLIGEFHWRGLLKEPN